MMQIEQLGVLCKSRTGRHSAVEPSYKSKGPFIYEPDCGAGAGYSSRWFWRRLMKMVATGPHKQAGGTTSGKTSCQNSMVFWELPFSFQTPFIDVIKTTNHRTACHMKLTTTVRKSKHLHISFCCILQAYIKILQVSWLILFSETAFPLISSSLISCFIASSNCVSLGR